MAKKPLIDVKVGSIWLDYSTRSWTTPRFVKVIAVDIGHFTGPRVKIARCTYPNGFAWNLRRAPETWAKMTRFGKHAGYVDPASVPGLDLQKAEAEDALKSGDAA